MSESSELCHCGQPLHYTDPGIEQTVRQIIAATGSEDIAVTVNGRTWLVQRHYIALHGLKALDLPGLGFPEITVDTNK